MRRCDLDACEGKHKARGLCGKHYYRWLTHGDTGTVLPGHRYSEIDPAERIARWSEPRGECLVYGRGYVQRSGHRNIVVHGRQVGVHRVAWALAHGEPPDDLCVLHHCDVPDCVNVAHLFLGTPEDNNRDRDEKGRHVALVGSRHGNAKLSEWQVLEMLRLRGAGATQQVLAERFGTTQTNVSLILRGRAWGHVPRPAAVAS